PLTYPITKKIDTKVTYVYTHPIRPARPPKPSRRCEVHRPLRPDGHRQGSARIMVSTSRGATTRPPDPHPPPIQSTTGPRRPAVCQHHKRPSLSETDHPVVGI